MNLYNLLSTIEVETIGTVANVTFSWLDKVVKWIIERPSSIALGIVLFTLLLKLITLPFDIFSRASMKKNSLKMEKMRPELEKLQRQYANNKELYNKKMMALYKKEGYSTCAGCLPTIITLVFFFVVIASFNTYSSYANIKMYNDMATAYTQNIQENPLVYNDQENGKLYLITSKNGDFDKFLAENYPFLKIENNVSSYEAEFSITDENAYNEYLNTKQYTTLKFDDVLYYIGQEFLDKTVYESARDASKTAFEGNLDGLVITGTKNIWVPDVAYKHPLPSFSELQNNVKNKSSALSAESYKELTKNINNKKPNGYFVLVILSIGIMLLSQFVSTKSQKTQMELQTVDGANGQAAQTQKMMLWMMPIMFGIFAFVYTAAFSIYMTVSSLLSTISTVAINYFTEKAYNKNVKKLEDELLNRRLHK